MLQVYNKYGQLKVVSSTSSTGVSSVSGVSPITSTGGSNPIISTLIHTNKLLGRSSAGTGIMEEITLGTGLAFTGSTLNVTGTVVAHALTKTNDTNVTLTLGGTPATSLLQDVSLTLGWTGTLADSRIASASTWNAKQNALSGTGFVKSTAGVISYDNNTYYLASNPSNFITSSALAPYLTSATAALTYYAIPTGTTSQYIRGDGSLATFPTIPTVTPAALTKTDDTNVTLTLGGTPATALLEATSLTLGWTGTLADSRITSATDWNTAYTNRITSLTTTGSGAATLIANVLNIPTPPSATFTSLTTTGSSGSSTLLSGVLNVPTYTLSGLGGGTWATLNYPTWTTGTPFVKMTAAGTFALDTNTYLTSITSSDVTTALGYTPVTNARTLTINGVGYDLTADRSWTITAGVSSVTATSPITSSGGATPVISTSMSTNKLIGRTTSGTGVMEEISIGTGLTLSAGTLSNSATYTSPLTTKGDIFVRNATVDTRLPIGLDTQILIADSTQSTGMKWGSNTTATPTGYYGAFEDNTIQTAVAINTPYAMKFGITDLSNGVTIVSDGSNLTRVTIANTGIYNIQFSAQFDRTNSGTDSVDIWLRKNGVDVPGSGGKIVLSGSATASQIIATWNYVLNVVGGDYYQLMWSTPDTHVRLLYEAAQTSPFAHPIIPSVILTVTQQSGIMAGTGITAINSLTGATQTLTTGTTGTDFAISSTGTTHTFNLPTASASNRGALSSADWTIFNSKGSGTVTSVAALTLGTSGTDLTSTVANGTTTPVITLNVPTASATARGALSSANWTTFNAKPNLGLVQAMTQGFQNIF